MFFCPLPFDRPSSIPCRAITVFRIDVLTSTANCQDHGLGTTPRGHAIPPFGKKVSFHSWRFFLVHPGREAVRPAFNFSKNPPRSSVCPLETAVCLSFGFPFLDSPTPSSPFWSHFTRPPPPPLFSSPWSGSNCGPIFYLDSFCGC